MNKLETRTHDEIYWANYYAKGEAPEEPSAFAKHITETYSVVGKKLIELGCGNGRDARYFASCGAEVTAIDLCEEEIEILSQENGAGNLTFRSGDFTRLTDVDDKFDIIYSRFTMHSIDAPGQERVLSWCSDNIAHDGLLCIETRGQKNELYRKGEPVEGQKDAYIYNDHYRRFVDFNVFEKDIEASGFELKESIEDTGFAPFEDTDYHFIRIIAKNN